MNNDVHSTGRGGAGNIGQGEGTYSDASLLRSQHPQGTSEPITSPPTTITNPPHTSPSTGRGGAGNIATPPPTYHSTAHNPPGSNAAVPATTFDEIPEVASASGEKGDFFTGRGGQGNVHREEFGGHSKPVKEGGKEGLVEKIKHKVGLDKEKGEKA